MNNEERVIALLEELVAWTRFTARKELVPFLRETLSDPRHFSAFELSDGNRTQQQVAEAVGLGQPAVSGLWAKWRRQGIARVLANGRTAHIIRPSDYGLEPPRTGDATTAAAPARRRRVIAKASSSGDAGVAAAPVDALLDGITPTAPSIEVDDVNAGSNVG
jgi:hypothetical protein